MQERFAIIGLVYVGLPVALGFACEFSGTIGFDVYDHRIAELQSGIDRTQEFQPEELAVVALHLTSHVRDLKGATSFIVAVPTPIDRVNRPDLTPLLKAAEKVGSARSTGGRVVFESTVDPSVTEKVCGPVLERVSGLKRGLDLKLGYAPERMTLGDKEQTLEGIVKVDSGEDIETTENVPNSRNSQVPGSKTKIEQFGITSLMHDPIARPEEAGHEYGFIFSSWKEMRDLDGLVLAVAHDQSRAMPGGELFATLRNAGGVVDVKSMLADKRIPHSVHYWSL